MNITISIFWPRHRKYSVVLKLKKYSRIRRTALLMILLTVHFTDFPLMRLLWGWNRPVQSATAKEFLYQTIPPRTDRMPEKSGWLQDISQGNITEQSKASILSLFCGVTVMLIFPVITEFTTKPKTAELKMTVFRTCFWKRKYAVSNLSAFFQTVCRTEKSQNYPELRMDSDDSSETEPPYKSWQYRWHLSVIGRYFGNRNCGLFQRLWAGQSIRNYRQKRRYRIPCHWWPLYGCTPAYPAFRFLTDNWGIPSRTETILRSQTLLMQNGKSSEKPYRFVCTNLSEIRSLQSENRP